MQLYVCAIWCSWLSRILSQLLQYSRIAEKMQLTAKNENFYIVQMNLLDDFS